MGMPEDVKFGQLTKSVFGTTLESRCPPVATILTTSNCFVDMIRRVAKSLRAMTSPDSSMTTIAASLVETSRIRLSVSDVTNFGLTIVRSSDDLR